MSKQSNLGIKERRKRQSGGQYDDLYVNYTDEELRAKLSELSEAVKYMESEKLRIPQDNDLYMNYTDEELKIKLSELTGAIQYP